MEIQVNLSQRRAYVASLLGNQTWLPGYRGIARRFGCSPSAILSDVNYIVATREGCTIYGLADPISNIVRYVGQTDGDPWYRHTKHISQTRHGREKNAAKAEWISSLLGKGVKPCLVILEHCPLAVLNEREQWWIKYYLSQGIELVNFNAKADKEKKS
jgi:hypothetical protein